MVIFVDCILKLFYDVFVYLLERWIIKEVWIKFGL